MRVSYKYFMQEALKEAQHSLKSDDVPVGAVVVYKNKIVARGHNQVELLKDPTAHAEMLAITSATNYFRHKWLKECIVFVTIEPCPMCAGALVLARVKKVVFGASDPKSGAFGSKLDINKFGLNHKITVRRGILSKECGDILTDFFREKRRIKTEIGIGRHNKFKH